MKKYFLGVDNGGTVSKAAIFDEYGKEVAVGSRSVKILVPKSTYSERDMEYMWKNTALAIKSVIEKSGLNVDQIVAVCCTGHGNGLYLLDKENKPLRNAITSVDSRAVDYVERWKRSGVDNKALPLTAQSLWAAQPNALLAWIRDHEPHVYEKIGSILMAKDYIRFRLTGVIAAEITDMSATSLMNVPKGVYDSEVLKLFGIEDVLNALPPIINATDIAGRITKEASELTLLKEGTPVVAGMFDIDACALSSGVLSSEEFSIIAGTWGNNQYISREPLVDSELFMTSRYVVDGWFLMLEGSPTSAGNLEWFVNNFYSYEKEQKQGEFYDWLAEEVSSVKAESSDVIFTPFIYGCNVGVQPAQFYGMNTLTTKKSLARAVFEGVIFSHFWHIERLLAFRKMPSVIRLTGGASKSRVWCQMFSDITSIPVEVPKGSELGALGAAIVGSVGVGHYKTISEAVNAMTHIECRYEPSVRANAVYKHKYQKYIELINRLNVNL